MPICILCGSNLKTRGNLARHHRLLHEGKSLGHGHIPEKATLIFFANRVSQTLSCPLHFCKFIRNRCKDVRSIAVHFSRCHPHHQLCVSYFCQRCNLYIDPAERREHNLAHIDQDRFGGPFSPPVPTINPQDHSLTYACSPRPDNICLNASEGLVDCANSQCAPDDASGDAINISLMANSNGSFDEVSPLPTGIPTPSTPLAPSYPLTPFLVPTVISPILPSVDNILAGKTFLPSPPSPTFLDPTPTPPILTNVSSSPPFSPSTNDVLADLVGLPSQLTPEFLDPTPPEVPLDVVSNGSSCSNPTIASITPADPSPSSMLPSTADVLNGDVFLPSQPSLELMEPSSSSAIHSCGNSEAISQLTPSPLTPSPVGLSDSVDDIVKPSILPPQFSTSPDSVKDAVGNPSDHFGNVPLLSSRCPSPSLSISPGANDAEWDELLGNFATGTDKPLIPDRKAVARQCSQKIAALERVICDQLPVPRCDSPVQSPTQTSPILIPSTGDLDSPPAVQRLLNDDARRETLDLLLKTFRGSVKVDPPPDDVRMVTEIRGPTDTSMVPNASASLFSSPDSTGPSSRVVDTVAPPPPVSSVLHPSRMYHHPRTHRRVVFRGDASSVVVSRNDISGDSPSPDLGDTYSPNSGSTSNCDVSPGDSIPPAQSRVERGADTIPLDEDDDAWLAEARARLGRLREVGDPVAPHQQNPLPSTGLADNAAGDGANVEADDDVDSSQDLLLPDEDLTRLTAFRERWFEVFSGELSWPDFCSRCEEFAGEARDLVRQLRTRSAPGNTTNPAPPPPPPPRRPAAGRPIPRFDPAAAKRIQGLYHHSKKRSAWKLLCDTSVTYTGSVQAASDYFVSVLEEKHANMNMLAEDLKMFVPSGEDHELTKDLYSDLSPSEVAAKLRSAANTSPGADRVEYAHLKKVDPKGNILALVFNRCLGQKNVPPAWKEALTVLIYKKGDAEDVSNFRPIALMSCIYKLLMGIIAKRVTRWSIEAGVLSHEQKSARPAEGCYEHTYIMKALVGQARRNKKKLSVAWLDIRNAFGSVPHSTIRATLRHIGVPPPLVSFIMNAYTGASTVIRTPVGDTAPIPIAAGVKQGCPLSPILFNLCIELILCKIKDAAKKLKSGACFHYGTLLSCLAYADDLVLIARSKRALQTLLDAASEGASVLGFEFRPDKCASLSLTSTRQRATFVEPQDFTIQGNHIPALTQEQSYRYLGVPIGLVHNIDDIPNIVPQLIKNLDTINTSLLAPWQKLDAIRTFVEPCLTYALRAGNPEMQSLDEYKRTLNRVIREICSLPN